MNGVSRAQGCGTNDCKRTKRHTSCKFRNNELFRTQWRFQRPWYQYIFKVSLFGIQSSSRHRQPPSSAAIVSRHRQPPSSCRLPVVRRLYLYRFPPVSHPDSSSSPDPARQIPPTRSRHPETCSALDDVRRHVPIVRRRGGPSIFRLADREGVTIEGFGIVPIPNIPPIYLPIPKYPTYT